MDDYYSTGNGLADANVRMSAETYKALVAQGMPKEQARGVLPTSNYTIVMMQFDLRNLVHLLQERLDSHAQKETREYAKGFFYFLEMYFPIVAAYVKESVDG